MTGHVCQPRCSNVIAGHSSGNLIPSGSQKKFAILGVPVALVSTSSTAATVGLFRATAFASDQTQAFVFAPLPLPIPNATLLVDFPAVYHFYKRRVGMVHNLAVADVER